MNVLGPCPCCANPVFATLGVISISLYILTTQVKKQSFVVRVFANIFLVVSIFLCVLSGLMLTSKGFSSYVFAKVFTLMSASDFMDEMRCQDVRFIGGKVLEIGPGAGGNFRCWENSTAITSWDAIEVNRHFEQPMIAEYNRRNLTFPIKVNWMNEDGTGVNFDKGSYDVVVMTHVLCSVSDVSPVLQTVNSALKPGGKFYFLEHVAASSTNPEHASIQMWQSLFAPILGIVGNGCQLKNTGLILEQAVKDHGILGGYSLNMTKFLASVMPLPMKPHVQGTTTKPN